MKEKEKVVVPALTFRRLTLNASRYDFLRKCTDPVGIGVWRETPDGAAVENGWLYGSDLDVAVDKAIAENKRS